MKNFGTFLFQLITKGRIKIVTRIRTVQELTEPTESVETEPSILA
jgi:hypothetical protein